MAILTPGKKGKRLPSFRGRLVLSARNGKIVARSWPRKRGPAKTVEELNRQERFRQANLVAKYADSRQQALSRCTMNHLPVRPYDALLAAMAGRLWAVDTEEGTLYSMAARSDVSKNLDVLAQVPGGIMCRGDPFWEGCIPTREGQLYVSGPPGQAGAFHDVPGATMPAARLTKTVPQNIPANISTIVQWNDPEFEDWPSQFPASPDALFPKPNTTRASLTLNLQVFNHTAGAKLTAQIDNTLVGSLAQCTALYPSELEISLTTGVVNVPFNGVFRVFVKAPNTFTVVASTRTNFSIITLDAP